MEKQMSSIITKLSKNLKINPSYSFVAETVYEVIMGSMAYGVSSNDSDMDIYGVCVPSKNMVFPHLDGYITGFGPAPKNFEVYQKHHIMFNEKEYDVVVYSIIKYFQLCADNNPNMIDSLFVPRRCILKMSEAGEHMHTNRHMFLSKRIFDKMRGYAFAEFKKLERGYEPEETGNRAEGVKKLGYDVKSAYHIVRLMLEAEMVLLEGDLDLERNREQLKFVREGGYTKDEIREWILHKEKEITTAYTHSKLPTQADFFHIQTMLRECLEITFGSMHDISSPSAEMVETLEKIRRLVNK